jgi:hypothetical protein
MSRIIAMPFRKRVYAYIARRKLALFYEIICVSSARFGSFDVAQDRLRTSDFEFPAEGGRLALFCEIICASSTRFGFQISCFEFPVEGGRLALFCEVNDHP